MLQQPETSALLKCKDAPAWKCLIRDPLTSDERISLIADIFSDRDEIEMVKHLHREEAQSFVDVVYQVIPPVMLKFSFFSHVE